MVAQIKHTLDEKRQEFLIIALFFFATFLIRFIFIFTHSAIGFDEPHFLQLAADFRGGNYFKILHPYWSPLYPLLIALLSYIFQNIEFTARLISALSGSLIIIPVYYFAKSIYNKKLGLIAIGLIAVFPSFFLVDSSALSDSLYKFFSIYSIFFIWKSITQFSLKSAFAAGFFIGCAYLTKPEGFGYLILFIGFIALIFLYSLKNREKNGKLWKIKFAGLIGFFFIALPYLIYLHSVIGEWTLSAKWHVNQQNLAIGSTSKSTKKETINLLRLNKDCTVLPVDKAWHSGDFYQLTKAKRKQLNPSHRLINDVKFILLKTSKNFYEIVNETLPSILTTAFLILMALGLVGGVWQKDKIWIQLFLLSIIAFYWFIVIPFFHVNPRYFQPLIPLSFLWVAKGLERLSFWFSEMSSLMVKNARPELSRKVGILISVALISFLSIFPHTVKVVAKVKKSTKFWGEAFELKKAGLWLKGNSSKPPVIMSYNKAVDFYAGQNDIRLGISLPDHNFNDVLKYAHNRNADYLVLSSRYEGRLIEKFKTDSLDFLLRTNEFPAGIELVYDDTVKINNEQLITRIFKFLPRSDDKKEF